MASIISSVITLIITDPIVSIVNETFFGLSGRSAFTSAFSIEFK